MAYTKATGTQTVESPVSGMVLLETKTASASAQLEFTSISATYTDYLFLVDGILAATAAADLWMRHSTDGGSTFITGSAYVYVFNAVGHGAPSTLSGVGSGGDAKIIVATSLNAASPVACRLTLFTDNGGLVQATWHNTYVNNSGQVLNGWGGGSRATTGLNAIRFLMSSGNITSGTIRMYGMRK